MIEPQVDVYYWVLQIRCYLPFRRKEIGGGNENNRHVRWHELGIDSQLL